ncbi:Uncharacterised protein [Mycobacteroides abscessus subsp. abscessus]|nr:Uncharacterised protein [Mycobacteroides abscessus subsp. abscessus]
MVALTHTRGRHDPANGVGVMNEILAQRLRRSEIEILGQLSDLGTAEQPDGQRAPTLALHTGQAPHPCADSVFSAIAICSSRVARSARGAYLPPPCASQVP